MLRREREEGEDDAMMWVGCERIKEGRSGLRCCGPRGGREREETVGGERKEREKEIGLGF